MDALSRWAACGAMALTGDRDGPPLAPATTAATVVDRALATVGLDATVLGERAARMGLRRQGDRSAGGAARLLPAADGWVALSLPRPEDVEMVPALISGDVPDDTWPAVATWVASRPAEEVVERAALLGLAVGRVGEPARPFQTRRVGGRERAVPTEAMPTVVDLSALWAGPLCAHALGRAGATVVKVESTSRPDGARRGEPGFYDLLNAGKASVVLALDHQDGRDRLAALVEGADVVVTSGRARAIDGLGLDPDAFLAGGTDRVWVAVTGHGWDSDRVGFGDDAAAAAGLVAWGDDGRPRFAADAVADPLCGALAFAAALAAWRAGGRWFVDASLAGAAAEVIDATGTGRATPAAPDGDGGWAVGAVPVADPVARPPTASARPLGADNARLLGTPAP